MENPTKTDRRKSRTKERLSESLFGLIAERRRYEEITVQELIDRADVGRSTFYAHYGDKGDLLLAGWNRFVDHLADGIEVEVASGRVTVPVEDLLGHLKDVHRLRQGFEHSRLLDRLQRLGRERLADKLRAKMEAAYGREGLAAFLPDHVATSLFGFMVWWLNHGAGLDPVEAHAAYNDVLNRGLPSRLPEFR